MICSVMHQFPYTKVIEKHVSVMVICLVVKDQVFNKLTFNSLHPPVYLVAAAGTHDKSKQNALYKLNNIRLYVSQPADLLFPHVCE